MNTINLTLKSATPTEDQSGVILKLQNKDEKSATTAFGAKTQSTQQTYYMKVDELAKGMKVGKSADLDLDDFNVVERPFDIDDEDSPGQQKTINLKWLHLK